MKKLTGLLFVLMLMACNPDQRLVEENEQLLEEVEIQKQRALEAAKMATIAQMEAEKQAEYAREAQRLAEENAEQAREHADLANKQIKALQDQLKSCQ